MSSSALDCFFSALRSSFLAFFSALRSSFLAFLAAFSAFLAFFSAFFCALSPSSLSAVDLGHDFAADETRLPWSRPVSPATFSRATADTHAPWLRGVMLAVGVALGVLATAVSSCVGLTTSSGVTTCSLMLLSGPASAETVEMATAEPPATSAAPRPAARASLALVTASERSLASTGASGLGVVSVCHRQDLTPAAGPDG